MKKYILFIFLFSLTTILTPIILQAQEKAKKTVKKDLKKGIWVENDSILIKGTPEEYDLIGCTTVFNDTPHDLTINWERTSESFDNKEWESFVADDEIEWAPFVADASFELDAGESMQLCVHFLSYNTKGKGTVRMDIYADADSVDYSVSTVYDIKVEWPQKKKKKKKKKQRKDNLRMYPTSVRDYLNIEWNETVNQVRRVDVHNLIGKKVDSYKIKQEINEGDNEYRLELIDLDSGMYFISFLDDTNGLISTKIFSKVD